MAMNQTDMEARLAALESRFRTRQEDYDESLDTIWMLVTAFLIFFMHTGFSLLEVGSVHVKNTQGVLAKNMSVVVVGFICWYILGWPLAFGLPEIRPNRFAGRTNFAMNGLENDLATYRFWFFQGCYCMTSATIVSGAMAERTQLKGFAIFTVLMTSIIYPIVVFWAWSDYGFLAYTLDGERLAVTGGPAFVDFAGSAVVHMVGGIGGLIGAVMVGPRKGRFDPALESEFDRHNMPFCVLGTLFLWFGWYGFNCGSTLEMHTTRMANIAGVVAVNTTLAPCVGGLVVFILRATVCMPRLMDLGGLCNGILAGLVSITAGCASVRHWEAIVIGGLGGLVYLGLSTLLRRLKVDDVVDAFAVHGGCGCWGIISLGFFGMPEAGGNGIFYPGGTQVGTQFLAALLISVWVGTMCACTFWPLQHFGMLRLSDDFQDAGADFKKFRQKRAYTEGSATFLSLERGVTSTSPLDRGATTTSLGRGATAMSIGRAAA